MGQAALKILSDRYARTVAKDYGIVIALDNPKITSTGKILHGDGSAYVQCEFDALVFSPQVNEIVEGEVSEIVEFGAFIRLGPMDGLVHVSQVTNDYMTFDKKTGMLVGKASKKVLKKGDLVRAKVATVSLKDSIPASKIALTMRPEGMGAEGAKFGKDGKADKAKKAVKEERIA